jgi:hypothetical protein
MELDIYLSIFQVVHQVVAATRGGAELPTVSLPKPNQVMIDEKKSRSFLHAKIQIGSTKGPISFNQEQTVFHHDDIPERSRKRKEEVKNWNKSKILDPSIPSWNKSNDANKPVCERRKMENFVYDRSNAFQYNYRSESLDSLRTMEPLDKSTKFHVSTQLASKAEEILDAQARDMVQRGQLHRTQEMPVNRKLEENPAWNESTVLTLKELSIGLEKKTQHATQWTGKVTATLANKKDYIGPMKTVQLQQEQIRQLKSEGRFRPEFGLNRPLTKQVDRHRLRNRFMNSKLQTTISTAHSGVWAPSTIDGRYVIELRTSHPLI